MYEDEWYDRKEIVKSRLSGLFGKNTMIAARKCEVRDVNPHDAASFLNTNHIQGSCTSRWRLGLYHDGELVALMTFGKSRFEDSIELLRYCTRLYTGVTGGASRLFTHFIESHPEIPAITSYADRRWSGPHAFYPKLGFIKDGTTSPSYYYIIGNHRYNRMRFTKKRLVQEGFSPELTEHEIMISRKIYRIYDCGNYRYVWRRQ